MGRAELLSLLQTAREYLGQTRAADVQLRVGLYTKLRNQPQLDASFSWDGAAADCFTNPQSDYLRADGEESESAVVRCFRSKDPLLIYEHCDATTRRAEFAHLPRAQNAQVSSAVFYCHRFQDGNAAGRPDRVQAMILALDSSEKGFFKVAESEELRSFFVDLMQRIEYEMVLQSIMQRS